MAEVINFEKSKETEVKDQIFRLQEMVEAMTKSLDNAVSVKNEQETLVKLVKDNIKIDDIDFTEFAESLEKQIGHMTDQITTLVNRRDMIQHVVEYADSCDEKTRAMINELLSGLGVFGE